MNRKLITPTPVEDDDREACERCGVLLESGVEEAMEFDGRAGRYRLPGEVDEADSQGLFWFGPICRVRVLKNGGLPDWT